MVSRTMKSLLEHLEYNYAMLGQEDIPVDNIAPIDNGKTSNLSFCSSDDHKGLESILNSKSGIILCKKTLVSSIREKISINSSIPKLYVFVDNPRHVFIRIAKLMRAPKDNKTGISKHAIISDSAKIGMDCFIGDFTIIGDECIIGDNVIVDSRVVLKNSMIGNKCILQSGSVIGEDGFAFERDKIDMKLEKFPHYGKVIIENDVEIFASCSIARGSITDTVVEEGTKIDALCHIAHNVHIGKNTQVTAGVVIGGSTNIGKNCWLGLNSTIKHKIKIGDNVIVGSGSSVIHDVEDKDIVAGTPAKSIKNKITISEDKLFLMGGQRYNKEDQQQRDALWKKDHFIKQNGLMFLNFLIGTLLISL